MAKRKRKAAYQDPFAEREAAKYDNPIPSREFIIQWIEDHAPSVRFQELVEALHLQNEEQQIALKRRLRAMERDGQLVYTRSGYAIAKKMELIRGVVIGHKDGYGFVKPEELGDDLFLNARQMRAVFDGDRVLVRVSYIDSRGRREANIVEVLERNTHQLVGRYHIENNMGFVRPDNKRIVHDVFIPPEYSDAAKPGQIVIVEIIEQPTIKQQPIGKIIEVLGEHMAPGMEIDIAIRTHNLPHIWPELVEKQANQIDRQIPEKVKAERLDLRDLPFVTIDGEDAKDFDDAVYCEKRPKSGWKLLVAIADVSHYVQPGTALDEEAFIRGNSVYFPGEVIPMLPEILSNGLCSLRPNEDRLVLVCEMIISPEGKLTRYQFHEAVIHSKARLTYTEVAALLAGNETNFKRQYSQLVAPVKELYSLYKVLHKAREERGAIDFETTETRVIFGENRKIKQIVPVVRNDAHRLIEEAMLMANVAAAKFLLKHKIPILYRVHESPPEQKLEDLHKFLKELSLSLGGGKEPEPSDYCRLLKTIANRPDAHLIQTVLLRSLSQAVYSPENIGHFGLAYPAYTHFTSPIRRYPDLLVHRAIRSLLQHKKFIDYPYDNERMEYYGEHSSMTERRADEATRDALDWLKCEYMMDQVGEEFIGIITGVTHFGIFVELQDIYVEGLVHITSLKSDYYRYDPVHHRLCGERTNTMYRLGDQIKVRLVRVDLDSKKIDFDLGEQIAKLAKPRKEAKNKPKAKANTKVKSKAKTKKTRNKKRGKKSR